MNIVQLPTPDKARLVKACDICDQIKPLTEFYRSNKFCKKCVNARRCKQAKRQNQTKQKICNSCKTPKDLDCYKGSSRTCLICEEKQGSSFRLCNSCYITKSLLGNFFPSATHFCKECLLKKQKERRQAKRSKSVNPPLTTKTCVDCDLEKSIEDFRPRRGKTGNILRDCRCKACARARAAVNANRRRREDPAFYTFSCAKKRAEQKGILPSWADVEVIYAIYKQAAELTKETGITHHVDHIIPVKHPLIQGFHVPENLQILTHSQNSRKHNKFTPYVESDLAES